MEFIKTIVFCILIIAFHSATAQSLLANGGFEDENVCTEYNALCAPAGWISTAVSSSYYYFKDYKIAHNGRYCMAVVCGHTQSVYRRNYIRTPLVCSLKKDHHYTLSFFLKSRYPIMDSMGVYFSANDFLYGKQALYKILPTVYVKDAITTPIAKDTSWQKVTIDYKANGEENFVALGYAAKKDLNGNTGINKEYDFLVYLDDIAMEPADKFEKLCPEWQQNQEIIYSQHERHEFLEREIKLYTQQPPTIKRFAPTIIPHIDTLVIPDILFATNKYALDASSRPLLDSICNILQHEKFDSLLVEGHTDNAGSLAYNTRLSEGRANAVADYIRLMTNISGRRLQVYFYAFLRPAADNSTPEGRQKNRRVEILIFRHE
ncbi:MAG: OmpA family protein [Chitinophagaceae bacterium]